MNFISQTLNKMEQQQQQQLLERIARNTDSKASMYISLSGSDSHIRTNFRPLLELDRNKKYEMALVNLKTYYSFPNVDSTNNHFRYTSNYTADDRTRWVDVNIPEGCYELDAINKFIQGVMKTNGDFDAANDKYNISIDANRNTLKSVLTVADKYAVLFTSVNSIRTVLGFDEAVYPPGNYESQNIVNINSVSSLRVTSDIIGSSYTNGDRGNDVYAFFPNVAPGYKIVETPHNLIYLPITTCTISSMETKLTDQNGKLINLRSEELSISFHIREA